VILNREQLLAALEAASPGLETGNKTGQERGVEQGDSFVFYKGRVYTCSEMASVAAPHPLEKELEGAVRSKKLLEFLRKNKQEEIEVTTKKGRLNISAGKDHTWYALDPEIRMPYPLPPKSWKPLPEDFCEALETVGRCAVRSKEPALTCIHIHPEWIEGCDNRQACRWPMETGMSEPSLLRWEYLKHAAKLGVVEFSEEDSWTHFRNASGVRIACRRYAGEFPDLGEMYGMKGTPIELPGQGIVEACSAAEIFSDGPDYDGQVRVDLRDGKMKLKGEGLDAGYERRPREVGYSGPPIQFLIPPAILAGVAERHGRCEVTEDKLLVNGGKFNYVSCLVLPQELAQSNGHAEQEEEQKQEEGGDERPWDPEQVYRGD
jgi:hypothetical protein